MGELADRLRSANVLTATFILLSIAEEPTHGYMLMEKLKDLGLNAGPIYRELRKLEEAGLVESAWDQATRGPMKRSYSITPAGRAELLELANAAAEVQSLMEQFVRRWGMTV